MTEDEAREIKAKTDTLHFIDPPEIAERLAQIAQFRAAKYSVWRDIWGWFRERI